MKKYFITGLLIWIPLVITLMVLAWIVSTLDQLLLLIPAHFRPDNLLGFHVPGFGVLMSLLIILITGLFTANVLGQHLVRYWEALLSRIPVVKSIYNSVKQVSDTLFSSNGQAFRKALLIQYPREGTWTIAFLTGRPGGDPARHLTGDYVSVYVPTTPNPTSGFFLMLPKADVVELDMSVDEALKYIISMGVVAPNGATRRNNPPSALLQQ
ncbi:DUF502 domain-containing protein [Cognatazoarcus halotolerans]|uniref:DUF502 domain-containing protein n=1 Tax=Cognatazoarcus halotolerans TaxID=2686016 RepID=UPI00135B3DE6|nr:DUF502 domain-containing protein [Cognatazoarcus halotolerans]MCB1901327.1 DUF502 domain-containing protein [Rhodocyclaceae bacterium]MCP5311614.1 DUF502 domain-containing protein [Zoogloeaceae bacterium]